MKQLLMVTLSVFALLQLACYKDKGNYDYNVPAAPQVTNLDSLYGIPVGDTLVIKPTVTSANPDAKFGYTWRISLPKQFRDTTFSGYPFKFFFNLDADTYTVRLTLTDSSNGMSYFKEFKIQGLTQFTKGTLVLSQEGGKGQLSFVKPDSTVLPRIYQALHGTDLPGKPSQIIDLILQNYNPTPALGYWITCNETDDGGVHLNTNTLLQMKTLRQNFFTVPPAAKPGYLETSSAGVLRGVINSKLYIGAWQTYYGSTIYGYFGEPALGDYELYDRVAFNIAPYFVGYEKKLKKFVVFTNMGAVAYIGDGYQVTNTTAFDPKNVQLDLLHFQQINDNNCYAFGKAADGTLYELKFTPKFMGIVQVDPLYKRAFPQPALITANTKWAGSNSEEFYFTSGDKIYRYNPTNKDLKPLTTDFGGKAVTMIKLADDDNTLIAGVDGTVYFLDVSVGKNGEVFRKYTGIPGSPVDVTVKK
ncbi:PKD-like family lipoprotein [Niastella sp. OAS944]|uniref:PKD-like family lipoprotein n=1 Tax=Niastella sp. OAS944 TaxID=2664089 RepID=UPI00346C7925|nr:hypothetical protein [Chitinophagaceae bacterium OAS944]